MEDAPNPIPTKAMLKVVGLPAGPCRLPMGPTPDGLEDRAREVLEPVGRSEEHTSELQSRFGIPYAVFFFNDPATAEISTLSLHAALRFSRRPVPAPDGAAPRRARGPRPRSPRARR